MCHAAAHTALVALLLIAALPAAGAELAHPVPMHQQESGNYYVHGVLSGGVDTELLVDTGSGYVALSKATFARVRNAPGTEFVRDIYGAMANGKFMKVPIYRIAELSLSAECVLTDIEVVVMPDGARDILGLSALRRLEPFAMRLSTPALLVSNCGGDAVMAENTAAPYVLEGAQRAGNE
jgi:predicted aspartyl protease